MDMENILHNYLTKLRIISKIPEHGRLSITNNDLNIYYGGLFEWVLRKAYGDNKDGTTKYLIDLYREINSFSEQLMYNINTEQNTIRQRKKIIMLVSLTEKLKESLSGIRNLIGTYKDYLKIVSLLECLEQDVIIPQYKTLLKFIPKIYHTQILKTSIKYSHIHTSGIFGSRHNLLEHQIKRNSNNLQMDVSQLHTRKLCQNNNQDNNQDIHTRKLGQDNNQNNNYSPERKISEPITISNSLPISSQIASSTGNISEITKYNNSNISIDNIPKSEPINIQTQNNLQNHPNYNKKSKSKLNSK